MKRRKGKEKGKEEEEKNKVDRKGEDGVEKGGFSSRSVVWGHVSPVSHVIISVKGVHSSYKML